MAVSTGAKFDTDGKSVVVGLSATVAAGDIVFAQNWLGIAAGNGNSGDSVALSIDERVYIFDVGAGLSPTVGQIVYIDSTQLTGNKPTLAGWGTSSGGNNLPLFKVVTAKDANNLCRGRLIVGRN